MDPSETRTQPRPVEVVPVPYGPAAAAALHRCVAAAKAGDPLAPVTVVVPSNYVGVAARRHLASAHSGGIGGRGEGVAGVMFATPYRLAELLGAPVLAAAARRPVSTPVVAAALRRALAEEPGIFADVSEHAATEEALVGAYRELSAASASARAAVAAASRRAADVVRICALAREHLSAGWYDEADLVAAACDALPGGAMTAELGAVVVYLPQDTNRPMCDLLTALARERPVTVVAGCTGSERADAAVRRVLVAVGGTAAAAAVDAFEPPAGLTGGACLEVLTTSDADDEVRAVVRRIVDAARDGVALERIAVLYGTTEPYARLLHEHLAAAGIPFCGAAVRPVSERLAGRFLLGLLALADDGYRRHDVMALLAGSPLRDDTGAYIPATQWQRLSREAGVNAGGDWDHRLANLAATCTAEADAEDTSAEPNAARSSRLRRNAAEAERLREFVLVLMARLTPAAMGDTWAEFAAAAGRLLVDLLGDDAARQHWPEAERRGAERVEAALARLAGLDGIGQYVTPDVFRRTLALELDDDLGRVGRLGEGVFVGDVGAALAQDLDIACIVGLAEGVLPSRSVEDSLLNDTERLAAGGDLVLRGERTAVQQRQVAAAMAAAQTTCLLSFPRGDLRASSERMPSRWLLDAVSQQRGERTWAEDLASMTEPWLDASPSFAAGVSRVAFPATEQEYRLRALAAGAVSDPVVDAAAAMIRGRASGAFTRYDGNLAGCDTTATTRVPMSASALQDYVKCPHAFLTTHVLRAVPLEDPGEQLEMTALDYGNLVHAVLEAFVVEALDSGEVPAPHEPWSASQRGRLHGLADAHMADYTRRGLAGRPLFAASRLRRLHADLDGFLAADDERRAASGTRPVAAELAFGLDGVEPLQVDLGGHRTMSFRGRADRVDAGPDGGLVVYDYKTGKLRAEHKKLSEAAPDAGATLLQLPLYGLAARARLGGDTTPVRAAYWFVTGIGTYAEHGYAVTDTVVERLRDVVGTIAHEIDAGVFPARPHDKSYSGFPTCVACDPDGLGTADNNLAWLRKRDAPPLAGLVAFLGEGGDDG